MTTRKLSNRARALIEAANPNYNYPVSERVPEPVCRALIVLACLAAENPGLEWCNYQTSDYRRSLAAYRSDARTCQRGLAAVRAALSSCRWNGVTDDDVIEAASGGRVEVSRRDDGSIAAHYCAGQYYPTEYRHAIARAIERAAEIAARRRAERERAA